LLSLPFPSKEQKPNDLISRANSFNQTSDQSVNQARQNLEKDRKITKLTKRKNELKNSNKELEKELKELEKARDERPNINLLRYSELLTKEEKLANRPNITLSE
jgi:predicted RNase H-like nuclease (RuvC/YqgF family)